MISVVEPPINFTTDDAMDNQYYYGMPGGRDGLLVDTRVWAQDSVHLWLPMVGSWCSFLIEEYEEMKVLLECL